MATDSKKLNTKVSFMYRDASNYKSFGSVVVEGGLSFQDLAPYLHDTEYFCPADVGLQHPGESMIGGFGGSDDHPMCELYEDDFEPTDEPGVMTSRDLIERFQKAHKAGWPAISTFSY